jgi:hypothetical protein
MQKSIRRPSPALIVAIVALLAALAGTAVALPGKNTVKSNDIAKNAVRSSDVKNDSLKGKDIKESTLSKVPNAARADSANTATNAANADTVNGLKVTKIDYGSSVEAPTVVFSEVGLTITADCAGGSVSLAATTSKEDSSILSSVTDTDNPDLEGGHEENGNFDVGDSFDLLAGDEGNPALITFGYFAPDGSTVTGILATDEGGPGGCEANGTITSG